MSSCRLDCWHIIAIFFVASVLVVKERDTAMLDASPAAGLLCRASAQNTPKF